MVGRINERNLGPNGQSSIKYTEDFRGDCNNGGEMYRFKNDFDHPITVIYGFLDVTDPNSQYNKTFVVGGHSWVDVGCTKNQKGNPVNIRMVWRYPNTDYVPANILDPWDVLLIVRSPGGKRLSNLHVRDITIEIDKGNGEAETRVIGDSSVWGPHIGWQPGWRITYANWFG